MTEKLTFERYLFDHIFAQELALLGNVPPAIRQEWNDIVTHYRKRCSQESAGLHQDPSLQAKKCLTVLENLPSDFDTFMVQVFDRDEQLGQQMYQDNWDSIRRGYMTLTLYCTLSQ